MICLSTLSTKAQVDVKFLIGSTYYQGDLSPSTNRFSLSPGKTAWSVQVGYQFHSHCKIYGKYLTGTIAGRDSESPIDGRRIRNLSFVSPIWELGIGTEFNINKLLPFFDKYGINWYFSVGVNLFHFDPHTIYNGQIVRLQPLGTEGQGLLGYDKPYSLTQINIPMGIGLKFKLTTRLDIGFEIVPRITFTDYIDDVSKEYVNLQLFIDANKPQAAILSNRTGEWLGTEAINYPTGTVRGNPGDNDRYVFMAISVAYHFGTPRELIEVGKKEEQED